MRCLPLLVLLAIAFSLLLVSQPGDVFGQVANTGKPNWYHEGVTDGMLTVTTGAAVGFDVTKIATEHPETSEVWFRVEDNDIRFWHSGSVPTSAEGNIAKVDEVIHVPGYLNVVNFKAIAISGTANLSCNYAKEKTMQ